MKADDVRCVGRFKQSGGSVGLPIVDVFGEVMMRPSIQEVKERQGGGAVTHYRLALGAVRGCGACVAAGRPAPKAPPKEEPARAAGATHQGS